MFLTNHNSLKKEKQPNNLSFNSPDKTIYYGCFLMVKILYFPYATKKYLTKRKSSSRNSRISTIN